MGGGEGAAAGGRTFQREQAAESFPSTLEVLSSCLCECGSSVRVGRGSQRWWEVLQAWVARKLQQHRGMAIDRRRNLFDFRANGDSWFLDTKKADCLDFGREYVRERNSTHAVISKRFWLLR